MGSKHSNAATEQNWGDGPAGDVLAALSDASAARTLGRSRQRLVVTGGSYAGYLTAWIVGHDHRFKAAVAQRGVYDLTTFFGEGNAWQLVPWMFGGYPWDARVHAQSCSRESHRSPTSTASARHFMILHASQRPAHRRIAIRNALPRPRSSKASPSNMCVIQTPVTICRAPAIRLHRLDRLESHHRVLRAIREEPAPGSAGHEDVYECERFKGRSALVGIVQAIAACYSQSA